MCINTEGIASRADGHHIFYCLSAYAWSWPLARTAAWPGIHQEITSATQEWSSLLHKRMYKKWPLQYLPNPSGYLSYSTLCSHSSSLAPNTIFTTNKRCHRIPEQYCKQCTRYTWGHCAHLMELGSHKALLHCHPISHTLIPEASFSQVPLLSGFLLQAFPCTVVARWHNTCPKSVTSNILLADRKGWTMTQETESFFWFCQVVWAQWNWTSNWGHRPNNHWLATWSTAEVLPTRKQMTNVRDLHQQKKHKI